MSRVPPHSEHLCRYFQAAMDILARPWNGLIIAALHARGELRFSEIGTLIGIADRMLSERLKELEARGLLAKLRLLATPTVLVTRDASSSLAGESGVVLPICVDADLSVAIKSYTGTLATLEKQWLSTAGSATRRCWLASSSPCCCKSRRCQGLHRPTVETRSSKPRLPDARWFPVKQRWYRNR